MTPNPVARMLEEHETTSRLPGSEVQLVQPQIYEITFAGQAGAEVCAEFDDCAVTVGPGTTTLRVKLPDQGALWGLVERITGLGLKVVYLDLLAPSPER